MPLTRDFKETVQACVRSDPEFRRALLKESVDCLLESIERNEDVPAGVDTGHRWPAAGPHVRNRASDSEH